MHLRKRVCGKIPWRKSRILVSALHFCYGFNLQIWWCNFIKLVIELWFLCNPCPQAAQLPETLDYQLFVSTSKICCFIQSYPCFFDIPIPPFSRSLHQNHHRHKQCYYKTFNFQLILFAGNKRTSDIGILIDIPFELDYKNNHVFHNCFFTQKVVFFHRTMKEFISPKCYCHCWHKNKVILKLPVVIITCCIIISYQHT